MKLAAVAALAFVLGLALGSRRPCAETANPWAWLEGVRGFSDRIDTGLDQLASGNRFEFEPSESELTPEHRARLGRIFGWAESGDWATDSYTEGLVRP